jgi:hypothetical protein
MLKIELEILLDKAKAFTLGSENHSHMGVDALLHVQGWLIDVANVSPYSREGLYSAREVEGLPPLRDAIYCPRLYDGLGHEVLVDRSYQAIPTFRLSLSLPPEVGAERLLDLQTRGGSVEHFGREDHEYLIVLIKVVSPDCLAYSY